MLSTYEKTNERNGTERNEALFLCILKAQRYSIGRRARTFVQAKETYSIRLRMFLMKQTNTNQRKFIDLINAQPRYKHKLRNNLCGAHLSQVDIECRRYRCISLMLCYFCGREISIRLLIKHSAKYRTLKINHFEYLLVLFVFERFCVLGKVK